MGRLLHGDLGRSIRNREPVIENVGRRIRPSLQLAALAMAISLVVATPVGILSAARRNTAVDRVGTTFALFGICMPNFLLALLLIFVFGVTLRWLPISGYIDPLEEPLRGPALARPARGHAGAGARRGRDADAALEHARGARPRTTSAPRGPRDCRRERSCAATC